MKKLFLTVVLAAFGVAAQAGDTKACTEGSCCSKTKTSEQTKVSMAKEAKGCCASMTKTSGKLALTKQPLLSPKAMADAGK